MTSSRLLLTAASVASVADWPLAQIEPATATQQWLNSLVFRGMTALPVRVARA